MKNENKRIKVSIISGFLGSGKTTFINQLLQKNPKTKFALIENEFGEVGIDNQLIETKMDTIIEMNQGCICCTLNTNLVQTLNHMLNQYTFEHLLIETTGVAEPSGVAAPFLLYPSFKENFHLQQIIVLVDALHFENVLKQSDIPARQVAYADILIINKLDLIQPEKLISLQTVLKSLNPDAPIFFTTHSKIENYEILNNNTSKLENYLEHTHEHHHSHPYNSVFITIQEPLDMLKFQNWMNMMLQIQSGRIYRVKGWVQCYGFDFPLLFQSVGKQFYLDKNPNRNIGNKTELVFIGLGLEKNKIYNILSKLAYKS